MPAVRRHLIFCEGESEWAYLQRLQSFLDQQPLNVGVFETPLKFIAPERAVAKTGSFGKLERHYRQMRKENKARSIQIWADFDLYHRNDFACADNYKKKPAGIPDFHFSFHNFEDFFALHWEGQPINNWLHFGRHSGHFAVPLHAEGYLPEIKRIFPEYEKGSLPADFVNRQSLRNLKRNRALQTRNVNPHELSGILSFADFLIAEIERAYPEIAL